MDIINGDLGKVKTCKNSDWQYLNIDGNWRKLKVLIFLKFCLPGVIKIEVSDFCENSCTRGVMKIAEN